MNLALFVLVGGARAATLTTCGDAPVEGCYTTLGAAVEAAASSDVIHVAAGRYPESITISGKWLTLIADGDVVVTGDGTGAATLAVAAGSALDSTGVSFSSADARAITVGSDAQAIVRDALISTTSAQIDGGAVWVQGGEFVAEGSTFGPASVSGRGGHIYVEDGELVLAHCLLYGGFARQDGGSVAGQDSIVVAAWTEFRDNVAGWSGGAISVDGSTELSGLSVSRSRFVDNVAATGGGAIVAAGTGRARHDVADSLFQGNDGRQAAGGAVYIVSDTLEAERNAFCGNRTDARWGAAVGISGRGRTTFRNNFVFEHDGTALAAVDGIGSAGVEITHNHFLGLTSKSAPVLYADGPPVTFADNLVAFTTTTATSDDEAQPLRLDPEAENRVLRTVWWQNEGGHTQTGLEGDHWFADPRLYAWIRDEHCTHWDHEGRTRWSWPGRDVGADLDLDGSPGDAGGFGGPAANEGTWADGDGDGTPWHYDCDDGRAGFAEGVADDPYDGIDQDCDGWSDYDADRDGHDRVPEGDDCDDTDPIVHPGAEEVPYDGHDQDCAGGDLVDVDGDGYTIAHDCDDEDASVHPNAVDDDPSRDLDCDGWRDPPQPLVSGCGRGGATLLVLLPWWRRRATRPRVRSRQG